ncbi:MULTISPECIES: hypothetical protein [unclassified Microcoleus]|uniref:hypothetical protein n=1 Tax=unclassified Microcoleus TaxID=2642155 RepID=UPI002FCEDF87
MPLSSIPVYKDELLLGIEPYKIPVLFSGSVIIVQPIFSNSFIRYFAGYLIPAVGTEIGEVESQWVRTYANKKQFCNFAIPYFPNTYELYFKASDWLRGREFTLNIWEIT